MGPRLFSHGEIVDNVLRWGTGAVLQWGHDQTAMGQNEAHLRGGRKWVLQLGHG